MKIGLVSVTGRGGVWNQKLCMELGELGHECMGVSLKKFASGLRLDSLEGSLRDWTEWAMAELDAIIFITACGIAVRSIAPFIQDKFKDPAVLVMDEMGKYVISLLSGHIGGANELALSVAGLSGAVPVISTATDLNRKFAVDLFAVKNNLWISDRELSKQISASLLEGRPVNFYSQMPWEGELPEGLCRAGGEFTVAAGFPGLEEREMGGKILWLLPKTVYLGIGCRKGVPLEELERVLAEALERKNPEDGEGNFQEKWRCFDNIKNILCGVASIDRKKEETGILKFCEKYKLPFLTFSETELKKAPGVYRESQFVEQKVGVGNVCERAAVLASKGGTVLLPKTAGRAVTAALAAGEWRIRFE